MGSDPAEPKGKGGRPRSETSRQAILSAAHELLEEHGYRAVKVDDVAAKAGVGKQTIYRWWGGKAAVLLDAWSQETARRIVEPDTGRVDDDLRLFLVRLISSLHRPGALPTVKGLIAEAQTDPAFAPLLREAFMEGRREVVRRLLRRGVERKELPETLDIELAVDLVYGPVWYRLLLGHAALNVDFAEALAERVSRSLERA